MSIAVLLVTLLPGAESTADASGGRYRFKRTERCLMRKINRVRARYGLRRLDRDKQLGYVARRHANNMANNRGVYHDDGIGWKVTRWRRIAQNTGRGAGCRSLARAFINSSKHRDNILGSFRFFGVGTERAGGQLYVQEIFESRRDPGNAYHYP
jgi:uncharacterized protein YkwD